MFKKLSTLAFAAVAALPAVSFADGVTLPDASTQIASITTGQSAYSAPMFTLALISVGVMVGVKWIKRGKGAA